MQSSFAPGYKLEPYWWDATPRPVLARQALPGSVDVAIVGSGYTGLHAALELARAGRSVVVLDAGDAGFGCSSRNGGQISSSIKPGLDELVSRYGEKTGRAILRTGHDALQWIGEFVAREKIDCDFKVPGRFHAAHNERQFDKLVRAVENQPRGFEVPVRVVSRSEQHNELGTDAYCGGVVFENHASLEPALYHKGLLARVIEAGATVVARCRVTGIDRQAQGRFEVATERGRIHARDVVVATNGYTGDIAPWLRRRIVPIGSYMIATEPLPAELMDRLMPRDRIVSDTRKVVYYYRPSPDRSRIVFGGRVSASETNPENSGPLLMRDLRAIFPDLSSTRISHSWMGFVAYTFNTLPHMGVHAGVHYAMGYCGTGVSLASYMGMKTARRVLGLEGAETGLENVTFETRPLYTGNPWFLSASVAWYRFLDGLKI
jgi:glycine/D-amino acid oxidase-like deaminating enzyme